MKRRTTTVPQKVASKRRSAALTALAAGTSALLQPDKPLVQLFRIGGAVELVHGEVVQRPSARNKSPYVGDVKLPCGRLAIAHMPSMDMGGKCISGAKVLLEPQVDKKTGEPIGADVMGKFGTPKCEYVLRLLHCAEPENEHLPGGGCWVGAHPMIGEKAASALLSEGLLTEALGGAKIESIQREVAGVAGTDMRCDFLITHTDASKTVLEVKTVVDTDYDPQTAPERDGCVFLGRIVDGEYRRSGIFPWGKSNQKGPDGEKVVSARAIKHVRELTGIASGAHADPDGVKLRAAILFVVVREDAKAFRANEDACPSFARYLREARQAGVTVLARKVCWGDGKTEGATLGAALDGGELEVED